MRDRSAGFTLLEMLLATTTIALVVLALTAAIKNQAAGKHTVTEGGDFESLRSQLEMLVDCEATLATSPSCASPNHPPSYSYQLYAKSGGRLLAGPYGGLGSYNLRWYCDARQQMIIEVAKLENGPNARDPNAFVIDGVSHQAQSWTPLFPAGIALCEVPPPVPPPPPPPPAPGTAGYGTVVAALAPAGGKNCAPWLPAPVRGVHFTATLSVNGAGTQTAAFTDAGANCGAGINGGHVVASYPLAPDKWLIDCCVYVAPNNRRPPYRTTPMWSFAYAQGNFKLYDSTSALRQHEIVYGNLASTGAACGPASSGWTVWSAQVSCPNTQWNLRASAGGAMCGGIMLSSHVDDGGHSWSVDCCGDPPVSSNNAMAVCVLDDISNVSPY